MKKEIIEDILMEIENTSEFKKTYKNIVPIWTDVKQFPACAVMYESEEKERDNITNSKAYYVGKIGIFVFNKQSKTSYEDILSDLIEEIYSVIENIRWTKHKIIDATVSQMKRDGGIVHPYAIANIIVEIRYIKSI